MNIQQSVGTCFSKYINFSGRASRSEYWWFVLFCFVVNLLAAIINENLYYITALVLFLPSLAVMVRRLHDDDMSGWWALLMLLPIVGGLVLLYFMIIEGTKGPNRFGNQPA